MTYMNNVCKTTRYGTSSIYHTNINEPTNVFVFEKGKNIGDSYNLMSR